DIIVIETSPDGQYVYLYSMLFTIPSSSKMAFYERLLTANLFGKETGMASFSCNPKTSEVFLTRTLSLDGLAYEQFALALEELLQCMEYWREQYEQGQLLSGTDQRQTSPPKKRDQHPLDSRFV
ncbi:MAG: type III secretion system chaperone, partial [Gammaproteobacteria bacterium]